MRLVRSLALALALFPSALSAAAVDPTLLAGLKARSIGPAAMSGRVAAIAAVPGDEGTIYVGAATGGVWKSLDHGMTWTPIFDDQAVASIGAVAIQPGAPEVVWVGTGEGNPRNSASVGKGIYRTTDGGKTWKHLGLEKTERIHRILLDPQDPDIAWVAALGQEWGENPDRGVFKTVDGGRTWRKVLYVDERTGAADLVADPANPRKLFAAMWDYRRWPWNFRSGGPGSGLHVSTDGGENWTRLTPEDGLPEGDLGRIGLAIAPSNPRIVYALIEAKENAFYRSTNGGLSFEKVSSDTNIGNRPFYYSDLRVDPRDPERVYSLHTRVTVTDDGGKTWRVLVGARQAHSDHHDLWIDTADPDYLLLGNDGGVSISRDRGENWSFIGNLPLAQYYHVRVDNDLPYNIYGGLQDNGSWRGPSEVWENGGIKNHHWREVGFGDGFDTAPHPNDSQIGYAMSQEGYLMRWNLRTGERKDIRPGPPQGTKELRFNWNAGFAQDPFEPDTIYYGSQFLHRSEDRGDSWEVISPDLTTNKPEWQKQAGSGGLTPDVTGAENFTTLVAVAPSPKQKGVLWVGTDDGRLQVTRDGGQTWTAVEGNLRGVPANTWIPHVHPSRHDAATAFVVLEDHRRSNWTPYVYKTTDFGKTWKSLATSNLEGYALAIEQDPVDPNLLFLGTEFGLWVSVDGGAAWSRFRQGVPTVSVMDLAIHEREADLVIATHGRALYVIDDIRPLRGLSPEILAEKIRLFELPPAQQYRVAQPAGPRFGSGSDFRGDNAPYGALISFSLNVPGLPHPDPLLERERKAKERAEKAKTGKEDDKKAAEAPGGRGGRGGGRPGGGGPEAEIVITTADGAKVRTFQAPIARGLNRAVWDLRRDEFKRPGADTAGDNPFRRGGTEVPPGTYQVTVKYKDAEAKGTVTVLADPRSTVSAADRQAKYDAQVAAGTLQEELAAAVDRVSDARRDLDLVAERQRKRDSKAGKAKDAPPDELAKAIQEAKQGLDELEKKLWTPPTTKGIVREDSAFALVGQAQRALGSSWEAPTPAQMAQLEQARAAARTALDEVKRFFAEQITPLAERAAAAGLGLFADPDEAR
ncbi:MAG: hypothetical protein SF066_08260 [Thermoanaerobaculia bacterium]|nr:hypothetical protein [Thermoanaerobaculia bacterium]